MYMCVGTLTQIQFSDVSPGNYTLVIEARATTGETAVVRRPIYVCTLSSLRGLGGDKDRGEGEGVKK
jgi:hypothetical protein